MQPKNVLCLSLRFSKPDEIDEVMDLSLDCKGYTKSDIYLAGLRYIAGMNRKGKSLVN
uniref:Uncharacterized protein n=1 Tax=viral metagenome TaxID=1070528 RepID=A0A6M3IWU3_9ZZZZ